jgi:uncharacterized protein
MTTELLHLSWPEYGALLAVAAIGAGVQGVVGFGANLLLVPVAAIFVPDALPAALIFWAFPLTVSMVLREPHGVQWPAVGWATAGRLPGVLVGAWIVSAVASDVLSILAGGAVLLAVAASVAAPSVQITPATITGVGFVSGVAGTATAIGGPPMAVLYQHEDGPVLRATLAGGFVLGAVISFAGLWAFGEVEGWQVLVGASLLPGQALGLWLSGPLTRRLDRRWLRPVVLVVATLAASGAVVRGLL